MNIDAFNIVENILNVENYADDAIHNQTAHNNIVWTV